MRNSIAKITEVNAETMKQQLNQFEKIEASRASAIESAKKRTVREQRAQSLLKEELDAKEGIVANLESKLKETGLEMMTRDGENKETAMSLQYE